MRRRGTRKTPTLAIPAIALALAMVAGLGGCATSAQGFSDLGASASSADDLPTALPESTLDNFELGTTRWVGSFEGADIWLAQGSDEPVCFLAYTDNENWLSGCGSGGSYTAGGSTYWLVPDGAGTPEGAIAISKNVYASSAGAG